MTANVNNLISNANFQGDLQKITMPHFDVNQQKEDRDGEETGKFKTKHSSAMVGEQ